MGYRRWRLLVLLTLFLPIATLSTAIMMTTATKIPYSRKRVQKLRNYSDSVALLQFCDRHSTSSPTTFVGNVWNHITIKHFTNVKQKYKHLFLKLRKHNDIWPWIIRIPHIESTIRDPLLASKYLSSFSRASRDLYTSFRVKWLLSLGVGRISAASHKTRNKIVNNGLMKSVRFSFRSVACKYQCFLKV